VYKACGTDVRRALGLALSAVVVAASLVLAPGSAAAAGAVRLVSHLPSAPSTAGSGPSSSPVASADGAFLVFASTSNNLVSGQVDENETDDVFLFERATGTVTLVSHGSASATTSGNGRSYSPSISADGAFVAFVSRATNLVSGQSDPNGGKEDVFLFARATGTVTLVSHTPGNATTTASDFSEAPTFSGNGAFVAFISRATNLVTGQSDGVDTYHVFLFERATGAVSLVSHAPGAPTATANGEGLQPAISNDGSFVAFRSHATNLVPGQVDPNGFASDIFLWERATGSVTLVSHAPGSAVTTGNRPSEQPSISADGSFVAFLSEASDLIGSQSDQNGNTDVFLFARATGALTLVSHAASSGATAANGSNAQAAISADGRFVVFRSTGTNLVSGQTDTNALDDVFLFERATGDASLVSRTAISATTAGNGSSFNPSISADGGLVAFDSDATNLIAGQTGTGRNVFLLERATGVMQLVSHAASGTTTGGNGLSDRPRVTAGGASVAFLSTATNLIAGQSDSNVSPDVFLSELPTAEAPPPPADFNGDAKTDISVFRPSSGAWLIRNQPTVFLGANGDVPVPCDYNGDGTTDEAVFRPSVGGWYVEGQTPVFFGLSGDIPVPGDFDGDGDCDIAVFRPAVGGWYIRNQPTVFFGLNGDIPVPGDYDGNGTADVAIFRPSVGGWYRNGMTTTFFGLSGDLPVPGDYDANGTTDVAVFRPAVGGWYVNGHSPQFLGISGDIPQPGDYDGNGTTDLAVYRPSTGGWYVGNQAAVFFGVSGDLPLPLPSAIRRFMPS
jgi:Tol biopolymer transport system component